MKSHICDQLQVNGFNYKVYEHTEVVLDHNRLPWVAAFH